ncbi:MAG TPA: GNAT family N-acetyltransferase [Steroidobacteraceae bacterium]
MEPQIRILDEGDAAALFSLRRAALLDSPLAFLASPKDDMAASEEAVRMLLKRGPESVVFAASTPQIVGMVGLHRAPQLKAAHKANLWGMFVVRSWRGRGLGEQLLSAAISYARTLPGLACVQLSVSESAAAARQLYEGAGFTTWGVEPDALRVDHRSESERHMRLAL